LVAEGHAAMRFAWQRKNSDSRFSAKESLSNRLIYIAYNVVWWTPVIPAFTGIIDYRTGFIGFAILSFARLAANLYRNNVLKLEQAESFPLRGISIA